MVKAGIITGAITEMKVMERVEKGSAAAVSACRPNARRSATS
jgi:hypothetical protein